jgi:hypothetical protein
MARVALIRALTLALLAAAMLALPVRAQSLQRLTVTQLTLAADTASPQLEVPFHLIVTAQVREGVAQLDNLDLPILAELELLGDEHALVAGNGGTTYRETITIVAHHSGAITIAPVTLDAIDARDGKPKRYFSNPLMLHVSGFAVVPPPSAVHAVVGLVRAMLTIAVALAGLVGIGLLVAVLMRRRPPAPAPPVTLPPPVPVVRDARDTLREALYALRSNPTRAAAMRARTLVRRMVGATDAETLADVLRRVPVADRARHDLLRALERAGFTHETDLPAAIAAAIAQLERMTQ